MTDSVDESGVPAVAVVVPTYNRAASLERLLSAVESQAPVAGGFEVIVVDDGSTDDTTGVIGRHPSVRALRQQNRGPAVARNVGWRSSMAPLVVFTDDDTVPSQTWLAELVDAFNSSGCDALGGAVKPLTLTAASRFVEIDGLVNHSRLADGSVRYLITANLAIRKTALVAVGGFDEQFPRAAGEDTDLSWRMQTAGFRLGITERGMVQHEHPTTWRGVMNIFARHGRHRRTLIAVHHEESLAHPSQWRRLDPRVRYQRYRAQGVRPARAVHYVLVRYVGLFVVAVSGRVARRMSES